MIKREKLENWIDNDEAIKKKNQNMETDEEFCTQTLAQFMNLILSYGIKNMGVTGADLTEATMFDNIAV